MEASIRQTKSPWLQTVEKDITPQHFDLHTGDTDWHIYIGTVVVGRDAAVVDEHV